MCRKINEWNGMESKSQWEKDRKERPMERIKKIATTHSTQASLLRFTNEGECYKGKLEIKDE